MQKCTDWRAGIAVAKAPPALLLYLGERSKSTMAIQQRHNLFIILSFRACSSSIAMVDWGKDQRECCWAQFKRWHNNPAAVGAFNPNETDTTVLNTYYDANPVPQVVTKTNYHRDYKKIALSFRTYSQTAGVRREGKYSICCRRRCGRQTTLTQSIFRPIFFFQTC